MYAKEITRFSSALDREMHIMVYGHDGMPLLCFPTQDSMCRNYEDFGMVDQLSDYISGGSVQLFVTDTVDTETWSDREGDKNARAERQEQYYRYIVDELVPFIRRQNPELPGVTGLSMGANHALLTFLRRPDLFRGVIALSGVYNTDSFFDGWMNPTLYDNSPECFLPNLPEDHPYIPLYNRRRIILCCGQGAWEEEGVWTLRRMEQIFRDKGIRAWCDYWGFDVNHDWPWWFRQMRYFLPYLLGEQ